MVDYIVQTLFTGGIIACEASFTEEERAWTFALDVMRKPAPEWTMGETIRIVTSDGEVIMGERSIRDLRATLARHENCSCVKKG